MQTSRYISLWTELYYQIILSQAFRSTAVKMIEFDEKAEMK